MSPRLPPRPLNAAFQAATEAADKPAAQVLRDFMRLYVARRRQKDYLAEAGRQSQAIAARARGPKSDEAAMMRELEANFADLLDDIP